MRDRSRVPGIRRLRAMAAAATLFAPAPLDRAVRTLGFVQYDPIRRPARAQDLILRHRVRRYREGDLDRRYPRLGLEEDHLHVYGAMPREVMRLLHPRPDRERPDRPYEPTGLAADVLAVVREHGPLRPHDLVEHFGRARAVNAWGGFSAATTRALERLHYQGLVRIAGRDNGFKTYEAVQAPEQSLSPEERLRRLILLLARILAPIPEPSLRSTLLQLDHHSGGLPVRGTVIADLLAAGELEGEEVDGLRYVWPAGLPDELPDGVAQRVRLLAPFDPLVWDRRRFEHLWGWPYRFEAYTPRAERRLGYYALPMFLGDRAVGWANCEITGGGALSADIHFAGRPLAGRAFQRSLDGEVARLETMLRS